MEGPRPDHSVAGVLHLLGTEPEGRILTELGHGPLRTKQLTERVCDISARSIYRSVGRLASFGLIDRYEEPGTPSKVLLRLTEPAGRNLFRLRRTFGATPGDELCLLAELWEPRFVEELSRGPRSLMNLLEKPHHLTYHQVKRRTSMAVERGLFTASPHKGHSYRYELGARGRRQMGIVVAIGRWRQRYLLTGESPGLEAEEMATVLRAVLPLTLLPAHAGKSIDLIVSGAEAHGAHSTTTVGATVGAEGAVRFDPRPEREADGSASATINTWFAALLDGHRGRIRVRGDLGLVDSCVTQLHKALWEEAGAS
jgi:DNA-binding HxlR family transcriptional regulator